MSTRALLACHVVLLSCSLTGCSIWSLPSTASTVPDRFPEVATPSLQMMNSVGLAPTNVDQLRRDQYCELVITSPQDSTGAATEPTMIAGKVVAIDEMQVVLTEAVRIVRPRATEDRSIVGKIPYISRLYKNTSIWVAPIPIPGELRVSRASVHQAGVIPPEQWPSFRQDGFARIGVDFIE